MPAFCLYSTVGTSWQIQTQVDNSSPRRFHSVTLFSPVAAMGILEKISEIEKEIARTQKNKGEKLTRVVML